MLVTVLHIRERCGCNARGLSRQSVGSGQGRSGFDYNNRGPRIMQIIGAEILGDIFQKGAPSTG